MVERAVNSDTRSESRIVVMDATKERKEFLQENVKILQ